MNLQHIRHPRRAMASAVGAAATLALVAACGTGGKTSETATDFDGWKAPEAVSDALKKQGEVETIQHDNSSSAVQAQLYAAVLRAFGGEVEVTSLNDYPSTFAILSKSSNRSDTEMWTGSAPDLVKKYITDEKSVVGAPSGVNDSAAEGWYVPTYVIKGDAARGIEASCPGLPDWDALNDCVDLFKTADSGDKGRFVSGAKSWGPAYGDPQRIESLGLNFEVSYAGSEAALQAEWVRAYEQGKPMLGLMWSPHYLTAKYDLTRIEFPPYTPDCWGEGKSYACDWGPLDIFKLSSADYAKDYPAAAGVLENYNLTGEQLGAMMTKVVDEGKTADAVVADWMKENPKVWQAWVEGVGE